MVTNALMVIDAESAVRAAKTRKDIVVTLTQGNILRPGVDYGTVPGSSKPSLLKPGAERLCAAFGFDPRFEQLAVVERWDDPEPLFFYRVLCRLIHIETGLEVATGIGSCNSREAKYRWRWVGENEVPPHLDKAQLLTRSTGVTEFAFAVDKGETTGNYGKPAAHWQRFRDAITNGTARPIKKRTSKGAEMDAWEIGGTLYRIPNDDIFSLINTIDKMACKRALIAATLIGANASEFFTQDIEDMPGFGLDLSEDVVDGEFTVSEPPPGNGKPEQKPRYGGNGNGQQPSGGTPYLRDIGKLYAAIQADFLVGGKLDSAAMKACVKSLEASGALQPTMTVEQAAAVVLARQPKPVAQPEQADAMLWTDAANGELDAYALHKLPADS